VLTAEEYATVRSFLGGNEDRSYAPGTGADGAV